MCDPITITSAILTAGSVAANSAANSAVQNARNDVMAAERIRQRGLDQQADALNTQSQDRYQNFEGQQNQRSSTLADYFKQNTAAPQQGAQAEQPIPTSSTSSNIVTSEIANKKADASAFAGQQAGALGNLRSFGDLLGGISLGQARDASQIGTIGGFKRGSSNVTGYELEHANQAGNGMRMLGDIAGGLGKVGMSAGLSGGLGNLFGSGPSNILSAAARTTPTSAGAFMPFGATGGGMSPFSLY